MSFVDRQCIPLRSIASLSRTPTWLAKELWLRLKPPVIGSKHSVTNAHQFLDELGDITPEEDEPVVSVDFAALFIPIDLDLANNATENLLQGHYPDKPLETQITYELLEKCLNMCFKSNSDVYEQI